MSYNTQNYKEQGGARDVIRGELAIAAGGSLTLDRDAVIDGMPRIRQIKWTAVQAVAADDNAVADAVQLGAAATTKATGLGAIPCARNLTMTPSASMGTTKKATISGVDNAGAAISEELTFNNASAVVGNKAFAAVTSIVLPIQEHAPVAQVETATAAGTVTTAGNAAVVVKSALFDEDETIDVPVVLNDDAAAIALAIRTALGENEVVSEHFIVSGADAAIILTAKVAAANDPTLNIAIDDGTGDGASEGVTTAASSTNTTPGVAPDLVKVGFGDKLGLPIILVGGALHLATYLNGSAEADVPAIATSGTALCSNTIDLNSALNGTAVETLFIER